MTEKGVLVVVGQSIVVEDVDPHNQLILGIPLAIIGAVIPLQTGTLKNNWRSIMNRFDKSPGNGRKLYSQAKSAPDYDTRAHWGCRSDWSFWPCAGGNCSNCQWVSTGDESGWGCLRRGCGPGDICFCQNPSTGRDGRGNCTCKNQSTK